MKRHSDFLSHDIPDTFELLKNEIITTKTWDNIFLRGELNDITSKIIRHICQYVVCFLNWFELSLADIEKRSILSWVGENHRRRPFIEKNKLAIYKDHGCGLKSYTTHLGRLTNFVPVKCNKCKSQFLAIAGIKQTKTKKFASKAWGI